MISEAPNKKMSKAHCIDQSGHRVLVSAPPERLSPVLEVKERGKKVRGLRSTPPDRLSGRLAGGARERFIFCLATRCITE